MNARTGWRARAACRGTNPALFFDLHPDAVAAAKAVCADCPVRQECATHALAAGEEFGVWGGFAAEQRPTPPPTERPTAGPQRQVSDGELYDLLVDADPDRPALDRLLEHVYQPTATAYRTLERAIRLGVVERRGRALYPTRR
jgi:WhiB family transcriptional regulator, redox-sensing transcriptional regulator